MFLLCFCYVFVMFYSVIIIYYHNKKQNSLINKNNKTNQMQNNNNTTKYNKLKNSLSKTIKQVYATLDHLKYIESELASLAQDNTVNNIPSARRKSKKTKTRVGKTVGFTNSEEKALNESRYIPKRETPEYEQEQSAITNKIVRNVANRFKSNNEYKNELDRADESEGGPQNSRSTEYSNDFNYAVANRIKGIHANANRASNNLTN